MHTSKLSRLTLLLLALLVIALSGYTPATDRARVEVQAGLERSLTVFAAARTLGAVVSVAQGTLVDLQPGGVGISLAPGQALQPLDQLIDQFSNVMLAASVSFGIQLLLLEMGTHWAVSTALAVVLTLFVGLRLSGRFGAARWLRPVLVLLLVARVAVPVCALGHEALYRLFMADSYHQDLSVINTSAAAVQGAKDPDTTVDDGLLARILQWKRSLPDLKTRYEAILAAASHWSRAMVKLIALFIVQTIVFPLVFLGVFWRFAKMLVSDAMQMEPPEEGKRLSGKS